jgi:hypothetical protein
MMYGMGGGLGLLMWLIVMADLVLVGIWLYQQVTKK